MIKAIYKITNKINGKVYIGQTIHPDKRWWEHCAHARRKDDKYALHLAIAKYGENNFQMDILEWTENYDQREKELIKEYNSLCPNGYNMIEGGSSPVLKGELNPRNTIKDNDVLAIIQELKNNKLTDRAIAKKYNTTDKIVADINHGITHKMENEIYPIRIRKGLQKLTEAQADEIKMLLCTTTLSYQQIADQYGVTKGNIYQINTGRSFKRDKDTYPIRRDL